MSELLESPSTSTSDKTKVTVFTRSFQLEGFMHTPRVGKEGRRLTQTLNTDKAFIAMTDVVVIDRPTGKIDPGTYPVLHVNMNTIEFIQPHLD